MIEELIRRLQLKNLTVEEEQKLSNEIDQAKELIAKNQEERKIYNEKLSKLQQDEEKQKKLDELDDEISSIQKRLDKENKKYDIFAVFYALFIVAMVASGIFLPIGSLQLRAVLTVFIGIPLGLGLMFPLAKFVSRKLVRLTKELNSLKQKKQEMIDEIQIESTKTLDSIIEACDENISKDAVLKNENSHEELPDKLIYESNVDIF